MHYFVNDLRVYRPEADDVRAMQEQLSTLHLVMEQSSSEHEKKVCEGCEVCAECVRGLMDQYTTCMYSRL